MADRATKNSYLTLVFVWIAGGTKEMTVAVSVTLAELRLCSCTRVCLTATTQSALVLVCTV